MIDEILQQILKAEDTFVDEIFQLALERYKSVYPEWEICVVSVERKEDRNQQIDSIIELLEKMKDLPMEQRIQKDRG